LSSAIIVANRHQHLRHPQISIRSRLHTLLLRYYSLPCECQRPTYTYPHSRARSQSPERCHWRISPSKRERTISPLNTLVGCQDLDTCATRLSTRDFGTMGNVSSRPEDGSALCLRDPNRRKSSRLSPFRHGKQCSMFHVVSVSSLVITSPRKRTSVTVYPNAFPPTRLSASRLQGDGSPVEFVQVS